MKSTFKTKLLLGAAVTALSFGMASGADAADKSADIEAGTAVTIDGTDTFVIDVTNDGEGEATAVTFNGAGANTFTVTSDGADATGTNDQGELGTISVTDGGGTNTFTLGDATNADDLVLVITGNISGDVATDANDLNIVVNAATTDDTGNSTLDLNGDVDLGTGTITLTGDATADDAILLISGSADQAITGAITSTVDNDGSSVVINNATNTVTFASAIGSAGNGVENLTIGDGTAGGQAVFNGAIDANNITVAGTTAASTANFNAAVVSDAGIAITGAAAGAASANFAGDVTGAIALTKATNDATITYDGTAAQTQTGAITANTDGDGVISVTNTGGTVTFGSTIGALAGNAVGSLTLASGSTIDISNDVSVNNLSGAGTINVSGSAELETADGFGASGTAVSFSVDAGQVLTLDVEATGSTFANVALDGAASGLTIDTATAGQTLTGNVTATTAGEGAIIITDSANATAIVGNIGTSASGVDSLTVAGATGQVVTTTGNIYSDTVAFNDANTLQLIGTSAQTVSGAVTGGILLVGNGTDASDATFSGVITSAASVTVDGLATATFNDTLDVDGVLTVGDAAAAATATFNKSVVIDGATNIDGTALFAHTNATTANTFTGAVTVGANQASTVTLAGHSDIDGGLTVGASGATFLIKKTATFDPTDADGNGTANEATDMILDANGQGVTRTGTLTIGLASDTLALDNGAQIQILESNAATYNTGLGDGTIILRDTAFVDLQDNSSSTTELFVRVVNKAASSVIASNSQGVGAADALLAISNANATNELGTIKGSLQGAATAQEAQDIAESISPTVDGGAFAGATVVTGATANITNTQLASLRDGTETGMVAGNISHGLRAWGQAFGQTGEQDTRDGIAGYDVDTYGFAVGVDTETLAEDWIWGLAFAYADTEVDSNNVNATQTDIDSYQVSLYSNYDIDDRTYVSGQLGYVWGENDQTRSNIGVAAGAGGGLVANADYDSETWIARFETGRKYAVGQSTILTPKALVNYMHYSADGYTETGTVGNAGLVVNSEDMDMLEIGVGLDASWDFQQADGSYLQPKIGVGVRHDVIGDEYETTSRFIGAGGNFKTNGFDPAQTTFNVGTGVTYYSTSNWELNAGYDYEVKSDYDAHSLTARAAYKF